MDLEKNNQESFREICALRLFQYIWKDPRSTTPDAKIVLSRFQREKPQNTAKNKETKVYFASQKIDGLDFYNSRISTENKEILQELNEEGILKNQKLIDELCEQTLIQALLSNIDAIKFDNFLVKKEPPCVVQFDFGDARENEAFSPDPLCIIDEIRKHVDGNSTRSTLSLLEGNALFSSDREFFKKHISPDHILNVIKKLRNVDLDILWKISYCYTYGYHEEKKLYADCLRARIIMFLSLEPLMQEIKKDPEFTQEEFSMQSIREIIVENNKESRNDLLEKSLDDFFVELDRIAQQLIYNTPEDASQNSDDNDNDDDDDDDVDIVFDDKNCEQEEESSTLPSGSTNFDNESGDEYDEDLDFEKNPEDNERQSRRNISRQTSINVEDIESEEEEESEITEEDRAILSEIQSLIAQNLYTAYKKIITDIELIKSTITISTVKEEIAQAYTGQSDQYKIKDSEIEDLEKKLSSFYKNFTKSSLEVRAFTSQKFRDFIEQQQESLSTLSSRIITHYKAYATLQEVQKEENCYDKKNDFDKMAKELEKVGVDTSEIALQKGREAKLETLTRIKTGKMPSVARS